MSRTAAGSPSIPASCSFVVSGSASTSWSDRPSACQAAATSTVVDDGSRTRWRLPGQSGRPGHVEHAVGQGPASGSGEGVRDPVEPRSVRSVLGEVVLEPRHEGRVVHRHPCARPGEGHPGVPYPGEFLGGGRVLCAGACSGPAQAFRVRATAAAGPAAARPDPGPRAEPRRERRRADRHLGRLRVDHRVAPVQRGSHRRPDADEHLVALPFTLAPCRQVVLPTLLVVRLTPEDVELPGEVVERPDQADAVLRLDRARLLEQSCVGAVEVVQGVLGGSASSGATRSE